MHPLKTYSMLMTAQAMAFDSPSAPCTPAPVLVVQVMLLLAHPSLPTSCGKKMKMQPWRTCSVPMMARAAAATGTLRMQLMRHTAGAEGAVAAGAGEDADASRRRSALQQKPQRLAHWCPARSRQQRGQRGMMMGMRGVVGGGAFTGPTADMLTVCCCRWQWARGTTMVAREADTMLQLAAIMQR